MKNTTKIRTRHFAGGRTYPESWAVDLETSNGGFYREHFRTEDEALQRVADLAIDGMTYDHDALPDVIFDPGFGWSEQDAEIAAEEKNHSLWS